MENKQKTIVKKGSENKRDNEWNPHFGTVFLKDQNEEIYTFWNSVYTAGKEPIFIEFEGGAQSSNQRDLLRIIARMTDMFLQNE